MLMILLSILSVIRHLICSNNLNLLLIYESLWAGARRGLLISMLGKRNCFDRPNKTGSINVKMDESVLQEKSFFKMLWLSFSYKLDWGSYIICIVRTASREIGALIRSVKFLSPEVALYLYKFTIRPCTASLSLFYRYYFGGCSSELAQLVPLPFS